MLPIINSVISQFIRLDKCNVDTFISKMHYIGTTVLLSAFAITLLSTNIISESMSCYTRVHSASDTSVPQSHLNSFCYATQTNTYREEAIPPFYRYQPIIFFLLSITFFCPKIFWNTIEGNVIEKLVQNLGQPIQPSVERISELRQLAQYVNRNRAGHKLLTLCYFITDCMYLLNLVIQVAIFDQILQGCFLSYGIEMNLEEVFPKTALCIYSDHSQSVEATCFLHVNYFSDKFVLFLWYWWLVLGILTSCLLVFHVAFICSTWFRHYVFYKKAGRFVRQDHLTRILSGLSWSEKISETIFLQLIVQNLENDTSAHFLDKL